MKICFAIVVLSLSVWSAAAQDEPVEEHGGFKKENLFTGGGVSLGFSNYNFQAGLSPFLGYSVASWIDAGVAVNYNYASQRDFFFNGNNDKVRSSTYGGGVFTRLYPLRFLFAQGQFEHNFISQKFLPGNGSASSKSKVEANSLLLGVGYASDRYANSGQPFFYLSLLFDVLGNQYSPYTRSDGSILPIFRGGLQIPLFQGRGMGMRR